ncbi:hypothetical protein [Agromyces sp. GXQ0307]|uniref:hypothetical protein n=1 Tax=Agromyces sp. GXQ0307 TaxID=3377835 RepID=UPI00383B5E4B
MDWARSLAIILALFSHVMISTSGWSLLQVEHPDAYLVLRSFTRTATPMFIILAGAAVELHYVRTWRADPAVGRARLLRQSLRCAIALFVIGVAAVIGGAMSVEDLLWSLVGVRAVPNAEIFVFYVVFFLLAVPLVAFRIKFGLVATLLLSSAWWVVAELVPAPPEGSPRLALSRIFGFGDVYGPSVFHAIMLAVVGMVFAEAIRNRDAGSLVRRWGLFAGCVAAAALVVGVLIARHGLRPVLGAYVTAAEYRFTNHPGYYAIGLILTCAVLAVGFLVWRIRFRSRPLAAGPFGGDSLIAFTVGNAAINLANPLFPTGSLSVAFASAAIVILATWVFVVALRRWRPKQRAPLEAGAETATPTR